MAAICSANSFLHVIIWINLKNLLNFSHTSIKSINNETQSVEFLGGMKKHLWHSLLLFFHLFRCCDEYIQNSPVPTNITSYVLPPGVFICGSTTICVKRYLWFCWFKDTKNNFLLVYTGTRSGDFNLKLTVRRRVLKLEVQSMREHFHPSTSEI